MKRYHFASVMRMASLTKPIMAKIIFTFRNNKGEMAENSHLRRHLLIDLFEEGLYADDGCKYGLRRGM
jgi:hypothetical protein